MSKIVIGAIVAAAIGAAIYFIVKHFRPVKMGFQMYPILVPFCEVDCTIKPPRPDLTSQIPKMMDECIKRQAAGFDTLGNFYKYVDVGSFVISQSSNNQATYLMLPNTTKSSGFIPNDGIIVNAVVNKTETIINVIVSCDQPFQIKEAILATNKFPLPSPSIKPTTGNHKYSYNISSYTTFPKGTMIIWLFEATIGDETQFMSGYATLPNKSSTIWTYDTPNAPYSP